MMEKLAQAGDGSVHAHPHFHYICHHIQNCVYAPAERIDTFPLFLLYSNVYSVPNNPPLPPVLLHNVAQHNVNGT
jgi:hypothetical protein